MTRELGGEWRHSQASARPKCLIQNALKAHAITDTSNRESGNSQWEDSNPDLIFFTLGWCKWLEGGGGVVVGSVVIVGSQQSHKYIWLRGDDVGSGGPQVNKSGYHWEEQLFLIERESVNKHYSGIRSSFLSETSKYRKQSNVTDWQHL